MPDTISAVQDFRKVTPGESAEVRKRAIVGAGVYTGTTARGMEEAGLTRPSVTPHGVAARSIPIEGLSTVRRALDR
jgi:hypothetical protein